MEKLSIVVPVFNMGYLVKRCIESLINQSYSNIEILIVNDGSTDDSFSYIEPYLSNPKIKYFVQENKGLGNARNVGIKNASGTLITFVDSDDWVDLDLYKLMIDNIEQTKSDIAICGVKNEFNNYQSTEERYTYTYSNILNKYKALSLLSRCENNNYLISPVVWNKVYKKSLILDNGINFIDNSYWEDDIFSFQVFLYANTISIVPQAYYHYFQREKSITKHFSKKHIDDIIMSFKKLYLYVEEKKFYDFDLKLMLNCFFDRAISSMWKILFANEPSIKIQKEYIIYFFNMFSQNFSISEAISYLDINRIKRIFT